MESEHVSRTDPDKNRQAPNGTATPPAEEQQDDGSSPLSTSDRIRSHVFASKSTETPTNWSLSSNESLFSIHEASTSFGMEQTSLMFRSDEFPGYISSPLLELPATTKSGNLDEGVGEFGVTESAVAEATMEVFTEQECQEKDDTRVEFSPRISLQSDASVKSFAFPVLAGEGDNYVSLKKSSKKKKEESQSLEENPDISKENQPEDSQEILLQPQTQKSTKNAGFKKWFGCFSCPSSSRTMSSVKKEKVLLAPIIKESSISQKKESKYTLDSIKD